MQQLLLICAKAMLDSKNMIRFFKTCVLWLLILALPMQVQAAVAQLSCNASHQQRPAGLAAKSGHVVYGKAFLRTKRSMLAKGAPHGVKLAKKAVSVTADEEHATCAPCVACCGAAPVLPNASKVASVIESSELHFAALPDSQPGYIPEGLERPPRHFAS
ncbi:hypothetical protein ACHMW6_25220 [Pseudoduganella sp. UC29_106]|uniref:hypothetical protein n=1 Tax=Pseudoduganella sp. UC29_106 TaxID=3374553 RepID=UPI003756BEAF